MEAVLSKNKWYEIGEASKQKIAALTLAVVVGGIGGTVGYVIVHFVIKYW